MRLRIQIWSPKPAFWLQSLHFRCSTKVSRGHDPQLYHFQPNICPLPRSFDDSQPRTIHRSLPFRRQRLQKKTSRPQESQGWGSSGDLLDRTSFGHVLGLLHGHVHHPVLESLVQRTTLGGVSARLEESFLEELGQVSTLGDSSRLVCHTRITSSHRLQPLPLDPPQTKEKQRKRVKSIAIPSTAHVFRKNQGTLCHAEEPHAGVLTSNIVQRRTEPHAAPVGSDASER